MHEHRRSLHSGPQALLSTIRQYYWPLNGRSVLRNFITCFKANPCALVQKVGALPSVKVTPSQVFHSIVVDYAGPYLLKDGKLRNRKFIKDYICVFVCLAAKAVHIELTTDLSTYGFLNSLKRFVSR